MAHTVICKYCGIKFDRDKYPFVQVSSRRYAHKECAEVEEKELEEKKSEKTELDNYIMELFNEDYVNPRIQKQIKQYVEEYDYTYSGIRKTLIYFYEVKGNSIKKSNGGIGIVPYIYNEAYSYYYLIEKAKQVNQDKNLERFKLKEEIVHIKSPERKIRKKRFFSFLDEEV